MPVLPCDPSVNEQIKRNTIFQFVQGRKKIISFLFMQKYDAKKSNVCTYDVEKKK